MRWFVVMIIAAILGGCRASASELFPQLSAEEDGTKLKISALFSEKKPGAHWFAVDESDHVAVTFRGETRDLDLPMKYASQSLFEITSPLVAGEPITFDVTLDGEPTISSTIEIVPVAIDDIPVSIPRSKNFTFSWTPRVEEEMTWDVTGCQSGQGYIEPRATSATIGAYTLKGPDLGTCAAVLELRRTQVAPVSPQFAGGEIYFQQQTQSLPFMSTD